MEVRDSGLRQFDCSDRHLGSLSYRNMCRFNSGFFYHHDLLQKYRYYWRVEWVTVRSLLADRSLTMLQAKCEILLQH